MVEKMNADFWQARAALCELLALSFRYPDSVLADVVASGEWNDAAEEITSIVGVEWGASDVYDADESDVVDPEELLHKLRAEATHLFIGSPEPVASPYEGVWRAADDGVDALLFVNPHSMEVERFCKACGLGRPEGTNEPLDHAATELELLEYLAARAAVDAAGEAVTDEGSVAPVILSEAKDPFVDQDEDGNHLNNGSQKDTSALSENDNVEKASASDNETVDSDAESIMVASADLPGGSAVAAFDLFMVSHVQLWMPKFAVKVQEESRIPFFKTAAKLLEQSLKALV